MFFFASDDGLRSIDLASATVRRKALCVHHRHCSVCVTVPLALSSEYLSNVQSSRGVQIHGRAVRRRAPKIISISKKLNKDIGPVGRWEHPCKSTPALPPVVAVSRPACVVLTSVRMSRMQYNCDHAAYTTILQEVKSAEDGVDVIVRTCSNCQQYRILCPRRPGRPHEYVEVGTGVEYTLHCSYARCRWCQDEIIVWGPPVSGRRRSKSRQRASQERSRHT